MIKKIIPKVLILLFTSCVSLTSARDLPKPALMLANVYHAGIALQDYWVSEKYDGVRAIWDGHQLISRGGNIYHAPQWFIQNFPAEKMDGELWIKRQSFEQVVSTVRKGDVNDERWKQVKYMVFDMPQHPGTFDERLQYLTELLNKKTVSWLRVVPQWKVTSHNALMQQLKKITDKGAEGLMLHRGSSLYQAKRSGDLLKVKPYQDAEAVVLKILPGQGKYTGMMGAIVVQTPAGVRFRIGTGFSDHDRRFPPKVGDTVTYQYRGFTKNGIPRFASYLRIRNLEK